MAQSTNVQCLRTRLPVQGKYSSKYRLEHLVISRFDWSTYNLLLIELQRNCLTEIGELHQIDLQNATDIVPSWARRIARNFEIIQRQQHRLSHSGTLEPRWWQERLTSVVMKFCKQRKLICTYERGHSYWNKKSYDSLYRWWNEILVQLTSKVN